MFVFLVINYFKLIARYYTEINYEANSVVSKKLSHNE